jgi:hypothetical protein
MKKLMALVAAGVLVASFAGPATAGKAKKVSLYLHGDNPAQETGMADAVANGLLMTMDATKPAAGAPDSMFVTNYVVGPNTACSGNGLLPVWRGAIKGTATGDVTVTLNTVATPATQMNVELFPDGTGGCDSDLGSTGYVPPAAAQVVDVAPGPAVTKVTFKNVKFKMIGSLILQLSIANGPHPGQVRVLYDSADFASSVQLSVK